MALGRNFTRRCIHLKVRRKKETDIEILTCPFHALPKAIEKGHARTGHPKGQREREKEGEA